MHTVSILHSNYDIKAPVSQADMKKTLQISV